MRFPAKITENCNWVAIPVGWVILHWNACGTDGRSVGCTVTWLPKLLDRVDYQIFLHIVLRFARFPRGAPLLGKPSWNVIFLLTEPLVPTGHVPIVFGNFWATFCTYSNLEQFFAFLGNFWAKYRFRTNIKHENVRKNVICANFCQEGIVLSCKCWSTLWIHNPSLDTFSQACKGI